MEIEIEYEYHQCESLVIDGVEIVYADFNEETGEKQWWFHVYRETTEKDVEDGDADEVDELLFSSAIAILFCPFCGEKLKNIKQKKTATAINKHIKTEYYKS